MPWEPLGPSKLLDLTSPEEETNVYNKDYKYKYPGGLDLKPGSKLHERLLNDLMSGSQASYDIISTRFEDWRNIQRNQTAFIPTPEAKPGAKRTKVSKSVIAPISYAIKETMLSQQVATFLDMPVMKYKGAGDRNSLIEAAKMEKVVEQQCLLGKLGLTLHTNINDSLTTGIGIITPRWATRRGKKVVTYEDTVFRDEIYELLDVGGIPGEKKKRLVDAILWEGTECEAIDPFRYLPDPAFPVEQVQKSGRTGWISRSNMMDLLNEEHSGDYGLFNVKYLGLPPVVNVTRTTITDETDNRNEKSGLTEESTNTYVDSNFDVIYTFKKLIPKYSGLGISEYPEVWLFAVAADRIIIQAEKMDYPHEMELPVYVMAPEYDGHSAMPIAALEVIYGMQNMIDFLYSSHMENVKRAINNMIVYDPEVINSVDLMNPAPGGRVRVRKKGWGEIDIRKHLMQLPAQDFTRGHLSDAMLAANVMYRSTPASLERQGQMRDRGERVSATEAKGVELGSLIRIERQVKVANLQVMLDLSYVYAANTQWYMTQKMWIELSGRYEKQLKLEYGEDTDSIEVNPVDLIADMLAVPQDIPSSFIENPQTWLQLQAMAGNDPELMSRISSTRVWLHIARMGGAQNPEHFLNTEAEIKVLHDEEVEMERQKGNIVPIGGS